MAMKRPSVAGSDRARKSLRGTGAEAVVAAISASEFLPVDVRTLLEATLPTVLAVNKMDRTTFEREVVDQAERSLATIQANLEDSLKTTMAKQEELTAPGECVKRAAAKVEATTKLSEAKAAVGVSQEAKLAKQTALQDAKKVLKVASTTAAAAEKERSTMVEKKECLSKALASDYEMLKVGAVPALAKTALRTLLSLAKEHQFDPTLMQSFTMAGKRQKPADRTTFEEMMFNSFKDAMDRQIDQFTHGLAIGEPALAQKTAAVEEAKVAVKAAEDALAAAEEEVLKTQATQREMTKGLKEATAFATSIWDEAKKACDAADMANRALTDFKEKLLTKFSKLKEKEPEPEPVAEPEPAPEATEVAAPMADPEVIAEAAGPAADPA